VQIIRPVFREFSDENDRKLWVDFTRKIRDLGNMEMGRVIHNGSGVVRQSSEAAESAAAPARPPTPIPTQQPQLLTPNEHIEAVMHSNEFEYSLEGSGTETDDEEDLASADMEMDTEDEEEWRDQLEAAQAEAEAKRNGSAGAVIASTSSTQTTGAL
jgi:hypothetical protein